MLTNHKNMFDYDEEDPLFQQSRLLEPSAGANGYKTAGHREE